MKLHIVYQGKVVSDSSGNPRGFDTRTAARNFVRNQRLIGGKIELDISGITGRHRVNPKRPPRSY